MFHFKMSKTFLPEYSQINITSAESNLPELEADIIRFIWNIFP
jgi:hypothetical protein